MRGMASQHFHPPYAACTYCSVNLTDANAVLSQVVVAALPIASQRIICSRRPFRQPTFQSMAQSCHIIQSCIATVFACTLTYLRACSQRDPSVRNRHRTGPFLVLEVLSEVVARAVVLCHSVPASSNPTLSVNTCSMPTLAWTTHDTESSRYPYFHMEGSLQSFLYAADLVWLFQVLVQ